MDKAQKTTFLPLYELTPLSVESSSIALTKKRILLGSSPACDLHIDTPKVSNIHAVLEITKDCLRLFDMNSLQGTFVNGEKISVHDLKEGDIIALAGFKFQLKKTLPRSQAPTLDILAPENEKRSSVLSSFYPLSLDPKSDSHEYIFEEADKVYPVFKYQPQKECLEVIIFHKDHMLSVDYLPINKKTYYLRGQDNTDDVYLGTLKKRESLPFIKIKGDRILVMPLKEFSAFVHNYKHHEHSEKGPFELTPEGLIRLQQKDIQIFIQKVSAPPEVASPPFFGRDKKILLILLPILLLTGVLLTGIQLFPVQEQKSEKKLERMVTIFKPKKKEPPKPKKILVKPTPIEPPKEQPLVKAQPKIKQPIIKKQTKKAAPKKRTAVKKLQTKTPVKTIQGGKKTPPNQVKAAPQKQPTSGKIKTYQAPDFSKSLSKALSRSGSETIKINSTGSGLDLPSKNLGGDGTGKVKKAILSGKKENIRGSSQGRVNGSYQANDLINKKGTVTADSPNSLLLRGSIDPLLVKRKLREHIRQYQFCDKRVLGGQLSKQGTVVPIQFTIGSSGFARSIRVNGSFSRAFKQCLTNVIRGIAFPKPKGGDVQTSGRLSFKTIR